MSEISEEKKTLMNQYANTCAQLGEVSVAIELNQVVEKELKEKAKELLAKIKEMK